MALRIARFDNSYARLPGHFHAAQLPAHLSAPALIEVNRPLAAALGLDLGGLDDAALAQLFSGQLLPEGAQPIALAYAGHQFGGFVPLLGDGRAVLLGEVVDGDGARHDIQFKGSGRTPYSRRGDGRAGLGPVLREYLVAEAMHALGVPTTRALAAVRTGETVLREGAVPGAVLTRVAASHIRVGTFEFLAARDDREGLQLLVDHVIARHYPQAATAALPALALFEAVLERQAALVARWMGLGFVHGVMNTDNMAVSGETIDYGPCAFMEAYDPATVFSSIDERGRYAYGNQPAIAHWNLAQLARALLPLLAATREQALALAQPALDRFPAVFAARHVDILRVKLGLADAQQPDDQALVDDWLALLQAARADFTLAFRRLCDCAASPGADPQLLALLGASAAASAWLARWRERLSGADAPPAEARSAAMRRVNPAVIPRNHRVEQVIRAAIQDGNEQPFHRLLAAVTHPWQDPQDPADALPAPDGEQVTMTFCGT